MFWVQMYDAYANAYLLKLQFYVHVFVTKLKFNENSGYKQIKLMNDILKNGQNAVNNSVFDYSPEKFASLSFVPITSVDVERSFLTFKSLFTCKR